MKSWWWSLLEWTEERKKGWAIYSYLFIIYLCKRRWSPLPYTHIRNANLLPVLINNVFYINSCHFIVILYHYISIYLFITWILYIWYCFCVFTIICFPFLEINNSYWKNIFLIPIYFSIIFIYNNYTLKY